MRRFGIEIELKGLTKSQVVEVLRGLNLTCADRGYTHDVMSTWKVVTDASVSNGVELVSPPMTNLDQVANVVRAIRLAGGRVDRQCGVHVHVDCNDLTNAQVAAVSKRYGKFENTIDTFHAPSRRANINNYCRSCNHHDATSSRYHKVNLQSFAKYGTVEFRQHAGSLNGSKLVNWVKFCVAFVEATVTAPTAAPVSTSNATDATILSMIENGVTDRSEMADHVGITVKALSLRVSRMRSAGVPISKGRVWTVTVATATAADDLFRGVAADVADFFSDRALSLGA